MAVRIADDGEILLARRHVFGAYWRNEAATEEAIDADGWFHTGDIGALDDDGYLTITGRKKELIVTSGGKNVAPAVLEDRLRAHSLVSQCMVVGDQQPYIGCLVTIDQDALRPGRPRTASPRRRPSPTCARTPTCGRRSRPRSTRPTRRCPRPSRSGGSGSCRQDFTEAGGELTPSLKLKRSVVMKEYAGEVAAIYA